MSDILSDDYRGARALVSPALSRLAAAAVFLALVAGMALWAYRLGTRDATEVPIIRALEGPARLQPADPGGLQAAHQGLEVNDLLAGAPETAPAEPAEIAAPAVALTAEDGPQGELVVAVPEFTPVEPAEGELRMPPQEDGPLGPEVVPPAAPIDIGSLVPDLIAEALAESDDEVPAAGPRPLGRPASLAERRPAAPPASSAAAPAQPAELASVGSGERLVQLGAFDNEGLARAVWNQLVGQHGDLLGPKRLLLERATNNARVFYRLRVAGFGSSEETRLLCEALRARGVDCIPVTLQ